MLKNITLSAEERLIEQARMRAQQEKTTLNSAFRDWLHRYVARDAAAMRYRGLMRQLRHVRAGRKFSREELNER
ncbi:MAG TPA: hypothetical protein VMB21_05300 [Candidatus Limnocylindria bacterium]|jgi:hypothetical protein|nr:hypothetical protein [Candidatus Limnocylindria bacterium]